MDWMIWVGIGIICVIIEIFTPGFFFMSIGVGAIITGLLAGLVTNLPLQILIFAVVTFIIFITTRKWSKKLFASSAETTNVAALIGKTGVVTKEIPADGRGYVKIGGEEWSAISQNGRQIGKDKKIVVEKVDGNKLVVIIRDEEKEN